MHPTALTVCEASNRAGVPGYSEIVGRGRLAARMTTHIRGASSVDTGFESSSSAALTVGVIKFEATQRPSWRRGHVADDVAILGAVGSYAQGWHDVRAHLLGASKRLDWTGLTVERLITTAAGDLAVTVALESELLEGRHAVDEWANAFGDSEDDLDHSLL